MLERFLLSPLSDSPVMDWPSMIEESVIYRNISDHPTLTFPKLLTPKVDRPGSRRRCIRAIASTNKYEPSRAIPRNGLRGAPADQRSLVRAASHFLGYLLPAN